MEQVALSPKILPLKKKKAEKKRKKEKFYVLQSFIVPY